METFFKQLKQNFELSTFYSDSKHGIKTQVWIALIAQLIFTVVHKQVRECELFTTLVSISTANLGAYQCLISTLKCKRLSPQERNLEIVQLEIFDLKLRGHFQYAQNSPWFFVKPPFFEKLDFNRIPVIGNQEKGNLK